MAMLVTRGYPQIIQVITDCFSIEIHCFGDAPILRNPRFMVDGESNDDDALGKKTRIISDTTCKNCAHRFFNEGLHLLLINQPVGKKIYLEWNVD